MRLCCRFLEELGLNDIFAKEEKGPEKSGTAARPEEDQKYFHPVDNPLRGEEQLVSNTLGSNTESDKQQIIESLGGQEAPKLTDPSEPNAQSRNEFEAETEQKVDLDTPVGTLEPQRSSESESSVREATSSFVQKSLLERRGGLLSHMDSVRALSFLDKEQIMVSVGEDCMVKLWNIKAIRQNWQNESIEPYYTLRGHTAPLFAMCQSNSAAKERLVYTAGEEGHIRVWDIPDPTKIVPYSPTDGKNYCVGVWKAHDEPVWQLVAHPTNVLFISESLRRITYFL